MVLFGFQLGAQDAPEPDLKSGDYQNMTISDIIDRLSELYKVSLYYKPDNQLTRTSSITFDDKALDDVLAQLLAETTLTFIDYRGYARVLAPRSLTEQSYSSDFYNALEGSLSSSGELKKKTEIGRIEDLRPDGLTNIRGFIRDVQTDEPIIGATVMIADMQKGTTTDIDGSYLIENIPAGTHELQISYIGYSDFFEDVEIRSDGAFDYNMDKSAVELSEVTIRARAADASVDQVQIGVATMDIKDIKKLPTFLGEVDVIKSFLLQPGVSTVGEGASGFNVRGGNVDQNLILQDEAILFNSSHSLGFFSTFNSDLIRKVDLYKANIPAQFGGRLVSVMDVEMRDGDFNQFRLKGGVGPISSKLAFEGPIVKDKVAILGGFRSSYTDWLLQRLNNPELAASSSFFYDGNLRLTAKPSDGHTFILSGYTSKDDFSFNNEFGFDYSTLFGEATYKMLISDKMINTLTGVVSDYQSSQVDLNGLDAAQIDNNVAYIKLKNNLKFVPSDGLEINAGLETIQYSVDPGTRSPIGDESLVADLMLETEKGRESAIYGDLNFSLTEALQVSGGVRLAYFQFLGPHDEFQYEDPNNPTLSTISGTETKTGTIATYSNLEPRVSMRLNIGPHSSIKAGYSRTSQFINQIFNTDTPTPSSQWQLSTRYIEPVKSHNVSIGLFKNSDDNAWETSLEFYGRSIDQLFDYIDFATLLVNDHIETDLLKGEGRAYGAEISIKKNTGALNGWLSYTYARSERRIDGINRGEWYLSNFDKTHDASLILNYNPNQRNTLTMNVSYSTGRPTTPPVGSFSTANNLLIPIYSSRNSGRIPDYFRVDLAYTVGQGYKKDKKFKTSWTFSIYNVLGRRNPFSVFFTRSTFQRVEANRLAILGSVFPSLTVNFELQ